MVKFKIYFNDGDTYASHHQDLDKSIIFALYGHITGLEKNMGIKKIEMVTFHGNVPIQIPDWVKNFN